MRGILEEQGRGEQAEETGRCRYSDSCVGEGRRIGFSSWIYLQLAKITIPGVKDDC